MSALFSFERIIRALANASVSLVFVIGITLVTTACSTVSTKQTASNGTTVDSLTSEEKSNDKTTADALQKLECREVEVTGTRFKRKICEYKETWAAIDKANSEKSGEYVRTLQEQSNIANPEGLPATKGSYNSAVTAPMGQ